MHAQEVEQGVFVRLFQIAKQCVASQITAITAVQQFLALTDQQQYSYQNQVIECFKALVEQLPEDFLEIKEQELTTRLLQPFLQPLFEDRSSNTYFRSIDTQTDEFESDDTSTSFNKRPDGCITSRAFDSVNLGFV